MNPTGPELTRQVQFSPAGSDMFRYTPPWQVLCHSLELHKKSPAGDHQSVLPLQNIPSSALYPPPPPCSTDSTAQVPNMESYPKRWVMQPLSPSLQPSDLRTMTGSTRILDEQGSLPLVGSHEADGLGQDGLIEAQQILVSQDGNSSSEEWRTASSSSSIGSQSGFYSFVEDPMSPEAEQNEAWMMSPQRQAQMTTLKQEKGFKLQTYNSKKPESLFSGSNGDSRYEVNPKNGINVINTEEERILRKEIIRSQAPKRNQAGPQTQVQNPDPILPTDRLIEGFSLTFSPVPTKPECSDYVEPDTIDKEQINFSKTRQMFQTMEQERLKALLSPRRTFRTSLNQTVQQEPDVFVSKQVKVYNGTAGDGVTLSKTEKEQKMNPERTVRLYQSHEDLSRQSSVFDDLDSGLEDSSVAVASGYNSDDGQLSDSLQDSWSSKPRMHYETPIEREIRLAQEREEDLRRSRGLSQNSSQGEMVRIRIRRSNITLTDFETQEHKQVDLSVLKKTQRENQNKEELYQQDIPTHRESVKEEAKSQDESWRMETRSDSESLTDEVFLSPCCPHRHADEAWLFSTNQTTFSPTRQDAAVQETKSSPQEQTTVDASTPPASLSRHREESPLSRRDKMSSSGLQSRGKSLIEKEIEETLQREQELRELRESMRKTSQTLFSPTLLADQASKVAVKQFYPPVNTEQPTSLPSPRPGIGGPSLSFITAKPWSPSAPASSSPSVGLRPLPRGLTDTLLQDYEEYRAKLKLEESSYAGIQLVDDINNELIESTRVVRHKNQRALLWEAGLFSNQENQ